MNIKLNQDSLAKLDVALSAELDRVRTKLAAFKATQPNDIAYSKFLTKLKFELYDWAEVFHGALYAVGVDGDQRHKYTPDEVILEFDEHHDSSEWGQHLIDRGNERRANPLS
ncbi:hypothetical protein JWH16_04450 [Xanthomonas campestris pv. campestris]|uniref:hypothetical protein n=1 Tax=Xanthomonas campestris TaxID=339 RepID=UPI001E2B1256|nr:hypothetical protein [Xanthomonas campestris]MCD0253105.1 hypothetical protein [Xanthomonas campestris pv. campestris]